ncbi:MAG: hypothetical protein SPI36_01840, partial [Candidatus Onthovivens sp.]|nr:hypothetical protein [Candidatus Onthovivens sp.]
SFRENKGGFFMIPMLLSNTELALVIAIPASVLVVIGILLILFFNLRKRKKTLIKEEVTPLVDETAYFAFGGKDNIKSVELKGSRLVIELFDQSKFVKDAIKDYGIDRVLVMSNKITLVGTNVNKLYELINN